MGAWGTGIFSDDFASDVRADWREAIIEGRDAEEVTAALIQKYAKPIEDDDSKIFWFALAAAQMETGRLSPAVRDQALQIIDAGGDVARWAAEDQSLARQRERVLAKLAEKLRGPQPKPKKLRRPTSLAVQFDRGDVVHVRNAADGSEGLFLVVDHQEYNGLHPVVEAYAWEGGRLPSEQELRELPLVVTDRSILPEQRVAPRPHMWVVMTHRRAAVFSEEIGSVIARGVKRGPSADFRRGALAASAPCVVSHTEWPGLVKAISWPAFREEIRLTLAQKPARSFLRRRRNR
jgi:hypothetical protein